MGYIVVSRLCQGWGCGVDGCSLFDYGVGFGVGQGGVKDGVGFVGEKVLHPLVLGHTRPPPLYRVAPTQLDGEVVVMGFVVMIWMFVENIGGRWWVGSFSGVVSCLSNGVCGMWHNRKGRELG